MFPRRLLKLSYLAVILSLAAAILIPAVAQAGDGFQPVSQEELKLTSEPLAPGVPAIILYRQVDRYDDAQNPHEYNYYRIKILTEAGRGQANVEVPFLKEVNDVVGLHARTIKPDGTVVNFDGKVFEKDIARGKGVRVLAKTFTLPDVMVGGIIEYYYSFDFRGATYGIGGSTSTVFLFDSHWVLSQELFTKHAKFSLHPYGRSSSYGIAHWNVTWSWRDLPPGTNPPKEEADGYVRLEVFNVPAFHAEDYMPPENELKARVDFIYHDGPAETDQAKYWHSFGKRRNDAMESFVGKRGALESAVAQIVPAGDSNEVKLQKIYARVQQLRNTSYEIRKTEQEEKRDKEKSAANAADVLKRGYGTDEQLTWLYLGLARAAGFEASGLLIGPRSQYFFNPKLLDSNRLTDSAVLVKIDGKDVYGDPGTPFAPYSILPWPETGVQALKLDKDGGNFVQIPMPPSSISRIERTGNLKLSETGDLEGKLTIKYTGLEAMVRRIEVRHEDDAARKAFLEDQVKEYIPATSELDLTNKPDWTSSGDLVAEFSLKVPGWATAIGKRAVIPVGLFSGTEKHVFDHAEREHPIYFQFPFQKIDDLTLELPTVWTVSNLPAGESQDAKAVAYVLKVQNNNGVLHVSRTLRVEILMLDPKYYSTLRNFFQVVRTGDEQQIVLQPGTATASK